MEIRWLEDFIALARTRHFSRAADEQNVTQPTFSRRIKLLEEEMGATLINRQTLPLSLTPEGEEFLTLCQDVTRRVANTRQRLGHLAESQAGKIRLAAPQSLLANFLPEWLASWSTPPPVKPYLRATAWLVNDYFQALGRDECDLVLCYWPANDCALECETEAFEYRWLGQERLIPVSLPEADGRPRFDLESPGRRSLPLIAYHPRGLIDTTIRHHLEALSDAPTFSVLNESIQSGNIRELVGLGYGLGWLPQRSVATALAAGQLVPAGGERWEVPLEIRLFRHRHVEHQAVDALWQALDGDSVATEDKA
ncbi:LysR family transcriptional regulator [Halomonas elongata]|uniref:LysR family transcription regulator n=2 Tax=Halomonas elongata TaxID=2746 RepID=E1VCV9_HALED|nr:LysR family transcriptional regulator [Halomonas elongata]MBW5800740.1 LysR family transcriptional regulator [Halomonas elongata]MDL4862643.1 LysR family transcriptional regulator [Halomonas elongata]OBX36385.1 HTH-type transcriptional regulator YjiE [Halomonas elongata]WBF19745.1 LysR family transcriptional regulator [Halomonas elongata]WPU48612.1 LysR family transcriptional regulator [Halomonas elongata DSM 2581]